MRRLLQGDVGSGKTAVAAYALVRAVEAGGQGALMAPTETLATQHLIGLAALCEPLGVRVVGLMQGMAARERRAAEGARGRRAGGRGRHPRAHPGRASTTERCASRWSTSSTASASSSGGRSRRRPGRGIAARAAHDRDADPADARALGLRRPRGVGAGRAAGGAGAGRHARARPGPPRRGVRAHAPAARRRPAGVRGLPARDRGRRRPGRRGRRVGGRPAWVGRAARDTAWSASTASSRSPSGAGSWTAFRTGEVQVLVATTVIEVGVDVPNATVMVIEQADLFGLAQLHQLRGRVGRGAHESFCMLLADPATDEARARLRRHGADLRRLRAGRRRPRAAG